MARSQSGGSRRPATKFANMQKKIAKARTPFPLKPQTQKQQQRKGTGK